MKKRISTNALAKGIADAGEVSRKEANTCIQLVFEQIAKELQNKNDVEIDGFGKFVSIVKPEKKSFDPFTQEDIVVPGKTFVAFEPDIHLKEVVNHKES